MSELYCLGGSARHYYSKPVIRVSTQIPEFETVDLGVTTQGHIQTATRTPTGFWCMACSNGVMIRSDTQVPFVAYDFDSKNSQILKLVFSQSNHVAVGFKRLPNLKEQAHIWISTSAFDQYSWQAVHAEFDSYSAYTQAHVVNSNQILVVGHAQGLTRSLLVQGSPTSGWGNIQLPDSMSGGAWSVTHDAGRVWVAGRGWIATTLLNQITNPDSWTVTELPTTRAVTHMIVHGQITWAVAQDHLLYSSNAFDYQIIHKPGRTFTQLHVHENKIYVGSHSLLTQSDLYMWDPVQKDLIAYQSLAHANAFVTV
jgi:hypothetical protein